MTRSWPRLLSAVVLLASLPWVVPAAASPPQQATIDPKVWATIQAKGMADVLVLFRERADLSGAASLPTKEAKGRYVYQALWAAAETSQRDLRASLDAQGVAYHSFYLVNALKLQADGTLVRSLAARPDVSRIVLNPRVALSSVEPARSSGQDDIETVQELAVGGLRLSAGVEPNLIRVNADDVWALGYTGQGVVVAGQDTGYDWDHPALRNQYRGWNGSTVDHDYNWHDAIHSDGGVCGANSPEPCDDYGHGTHTMGTIVGDDGGSNRIGMAPGARWIGCRNMDVGYGTPATYIECFEFFLAPYPVDGTPAQGEPTLAPDVVNNSWSCPPSEGCDAGTLEAAVDALRQAGIVVVVSAGNYGSGCETVTNPPAIYQQAFSVGAFSHATDLIASFSSRGPVTYGGETYIKPDIAAPGVSIRSSLPGGAYGFMQGTSMAAPHVAGAVALLLSAAPGYSGNVEAIEYTLTSSAEPRTSNQGCGGDSPTDVPNNVWGWGILDVLTAVESGVVQGTVTDAGNALSIAGATIRTDQVPGREATTDAYGRYTLVLATGTYTLTAQASDYFSQTVSDLSVIGGQITTQDFALDPLPPPTAAFTTNSPFCLDEPLILTNTSTNAETCSWGFGDGQGSTAWEPTHSYATPGDYPVTLVVTNAVASDSVSTTVQVNPLPVSAFHWTVNGLTVTFDNDSQDADAYLWQLGDGVTTTLPAPTHTYPTPATYPVTLTVYNGCGEDVSAHYVRVGTAQHLHIYLPSMNKGPDQGMP
jgi:serine protease AprX